MKPVGAAVGAPPRWWPRSRRARWSVIGAAAVGASVLAWHALRKDRLPDFSDYDGSAEKRDAFFTYLLPRLRSVNADILADRARLSRIRAAIAKGGTTGFFDGRWLRDLAGDYALDPPDSPNLAFVDRLLRRVDVVPPSLALAQAANESSWGRSRFAREGNNLFGTHATDGSGLMPHRRAPGRRFTVASYDSVDESVEDYVRNLNTDPRYRHLRRIRASLRSRREPISGYALAEGLEAYSKQGADYIGIIQSIIRSNRLERYDSSAVGSSGP